MIDATVLTNWIVFGSSGQDLNRSSNLIVASDNRIKLAILGFIGEINSVLHEGIVHIFCTARNSGSTLLAHFFDHVQDICVFDALFQESVASKLSIFFDERQQETFG